MGSGGNARAATAADEETGSGADDFDADRTERIDHCYVLAVHRKVPLRFVEIRFDGYAAEKADVAIARCCLRIETNLEPPNLLEIADSGVDDGYQVIYYQSATLSAESVYKVPLFAAFDFSCRLAAAAAAAVWPAASCYRLLC